jgi:hypothetical protein
MASWACSMEGCTASSSTNTPIYRVSAPLDAVLITGCVQHLPQLQADYAAKERRKKLREDD